MIAALNSVPTCVQYSCFRFQIIAQLTDLRKLPYKPESLVTKILWEKNAHSINAQAYA
jgi:hypothetical protein